MYLSKTPNFLKPLASSFVWDVKTQENEVFLTFDDGPHPEITPAIMEILDQYGARATFFCVGANIVRHQATFEDVLRRGHAVGNHTFNHESGWNTPQYSYLKSYLECQRYTKNKLFRPPFGRIKYDQVRILKKRSHLIMWDVLSGDFDPKKSAEQCASTVINKVKPGSIVVFHDSKKAKERVLNALPVVLENLKKRGCSLPVLTDTRCKSKR